jgi:predicted Zn-dependent peptidase
MTIALVGDLKAAEVWPIVETYFARLPSAPKPAPLRTIEPQQTAEREVVIKDPAQPFYLEGYHRPVVPRPRRRRLRRAAGPAVERTDLAALPLAGARQARSQRRPLASAAFPGVKYPSLFAFFGVPTPGHTPQEVQAAIRAEIERLKTEDVPEAELEMVKTRTRANLVRGLTATRAWRSSSGLSQARYGDWRGLFQEVDRIQKVTAADVRRVANDTFVEANRTVAIDRVDANGDAKEGGQK